MASSALVPGLRRLALRPVPPGLFACSRWAPTNLPRAAGAGVPARTIDVARCPRAGRGFATETAAKPSPLAKAAPAPATPEQPQSQSKSRSSSWPSKNPKGVAYWLAGSALSVFGIVVFGGLTRLTESG